MANEIQDICDQLVVMQNAVTTPTGEKDITHAYDEQPESISTFPCFVNIVREVGEFKRQSGVRDQGTLLVDMYLCFEQGSGLYADRSRRLWHQAVMDYFDQHQGLNGTVGFSAIERAAFDEPLKVSDAVSYPGIKFEMRALMKASAVALAMGGAAAYDPGCTLTASMGASDLGIFYTSTGDPIVKYDVIQIDSELMVVILVGTVDNSLNIGRGYRGTTAATHTLGAAILKWGQV